MSGYISLPRAIFDDTTFKDEVLSEREAYLWMLMEARWKGGSKRLGAGIYELERGQLATSVRFLAQAWKWSKSRVDRYLGRLERARRITVRSGTGASVITICNYDEHQGSSTERGTGAGQRRDRCGTNENKGERKGKESLSTGALRFEEFWEAYPHKGGARKGEALARAAYDKIVRAGTGEEELIVAAGRYRDDGRVLQGYVKDPLNWLGERRWQDDIEPPRVSTAAAGPEVNDSYGAFGRIPEVL